MHKPFQSSARHFLALTVRAALLGVPVVTSGLTASIAHAQTAPTGYTFDITAGPLSTALTRVAAQAGVQLTVDAALTAGKNAQALKGTLTIEQALAQLLLGSGIEATTQPDGSYVLRTASGNEVTLSAVNVRSTTDQESASGPVKGYVAKRSTTGTKSTAALADVPFAVQTVTQELRLDQAVTSLRAAAENVSGVMAGPTALHEDILIRGFQVRDTYRNGIPTRRIGMTEISNTDSVVVVKGPSAVMFGRGEVGGLVNVETKRPLSEPHFSAQQQANNFGELETSVDGGSSLTESVAYRVNGLYRNVDSFRDGVDGERYFVAPSLHLKPSEQLTLNLDIEAYKDTSPNDKGQIAIGDRPADVPRARNFSGTAAHRDNTGGLFALDGQYVLDTDWTIKSALFHDQSRERALEYVQGRDPSLGLPENLLFRIPRDVKKRDITTNYGMLELWGSFDAVGMRHNLVVGMDGNHSSGTFNFNDGDLGLGQFDQIDIDLPVPNPTVTTGDSLTRIENTQRWTGIYVQDRVDLTDRLSLLLGLRHDTAEVVTEDKLADTRDKTSDSELSPRAGLTFHLTPTWRAYGQVTRSMGLPNSGANATGSAFKPEIGEQIEGGFKYESSKSDLVATVALYDLVKRNVLVPDVANPGFSRQAGKAGSRGLEFDATGRIDAHLNLQLAYALMRAKTLDSTNPDEDGNRLYGVPTHSGRVFMRYDIVEGGTRGWSFGGGVYAASEQEGDNANTFEVPGYARWDAFAAYRLPTEHARYTFQLNVQNLADRVYYSPSGSRDGIGIGAPRTVVGTVRVDF